MKKTSIINSKSVFMFMSVAAISFNTSFAQTQTTKQNTPTPATPVVNKTTVSPGVKNTLNPQPQPPKVNTPGTKNGLEPQPMPPKATTAGDKVGLEPQPMPPKATTK
ncbi:MAG: hypothetical protein WCG87_08515 [Bacteroidota bacterium]